MVYSVNGQRRSPWRLSFITDVFWGFTDFIVMFFQSIINPDITRRSSSSRIRYNHGRGFRVTSDHDSRMLANAYYALSMNSSPHIPIPVRPRSGGG
ncbi:selenoprotein K-like [Eleutherodactylus coqui]|uniref:selenoprotein K-like n=1 Tax=Eleutherodactylus coqui TaxID=57060 RepID=UPI003461E7EA